LTLSSLNAAVDVKAAASKDVTMSPGNSLKAGALSLTRLRSRGAKVFTRLQSPTSEPLPQLFNRLLPLS
jgi:hypothetical protein